MSAMDEPTISPLAQAIAERLATAPTPLKLADVLKGLPKPKGMKPPAMQSAVREVLESEVSFGRAFVYPSGKNGEERFWAKDEKQLYREAALTAAEQPKTFADLRKALGTIAKGTFPAFLDEIFRELHGEDQLFAHPAKTQAGGALFGTKPPPPPLPVLEGAKFAKKVDTLAKSAGKLLGDSGATFEELVAVLRKALIPAEPPIATLRDEPAMSKSPDVPASAAGSDAEIEQSIFAGIERLSSHGLMSVAELRQAMPALARGTAFDRVVLALADADRVYITQDADPMSFSESEKAEYVCDAYGHVFTMIGMRGDR